MKIFLANSSAFPAIGGVENSLRFMGRELVLAGHEVKILCFQFSPDEPLRMKHEGIDILRYACKACREKVESAYCIQATDRRFVNLLYSIVPKQC